MNTLKKWWPEITIITGLLWQALGPQVIAVIATHPHWTAVLSAIAIISARLSASPLKS